jgi:hypothetical protein
MRYLRAILLFLFLPFSLFSQYYDTGEDPGNIKWLKIETGRFKVIFPESYGYEGQLLARKLELAYEELKGDFNDLDFKIPVVVHSYSTRTNGIVVWAPKRIELYPSPGEHDMPVDPVEELAIHELTHVFQVASLKRGISKVGSYLIGQHYTGFVSGMLPKWYLEGHAVLNETLYGGYGRGNSAAFQKPLKALYAEKEGIFKYDKLVNGSYKDFVPNYYHTGYQVVTNSFLEYGDDVWNDAIEFTAKYPFTVNPVHFSLKKNTGYSKKGLYKFTFDSLGKLWATDLKLSGAEEYDPMIKADKREYQGYYSPVFIDEDHIVALKTSMSNSIRLVSINRTDSTEKVIYVPGDIYPYEISASKDRIVWVEKVPDPRWSNRDFSIVKIMDASSGKVKRLTSKTRYMSVAISPDGKRIAAVNNSVDNKNSVDILDAETGNVLITFPTKDNMFLESPDWSFDTDKITFISLTNAGEGIVTLTLSDPNSWKIMKAEGRTDLQTAFIRNDTLLYVSSISGVENGYMESPNGEMHQLTNAKFGAIDLNAYGETLVFSDYTAMGNKVCLVDLASIPKYYQVTPGTFLIDNFEPHGGLVSEIDPIEYDVKPYNKTFSIFNLHSFLPLYVDLDEVTSDYSSVKPGATLFSQNLLGSVISWAGLEYSEKNFKLHSEIEFKGKYPVLKARVDYGGQNKIMGNGGTSLQNTDLEPNLNFTGSISIPLLFKSGRFYQQLVPYFWSNYSNNYVVDGDNISKGYTQLGSRLYFYNYSSWSSRDIYPKYGQFADILYSFFPFDSKYFGDAFTLRSAIYLPGGIKNSSIRLRYEMEIQKAKLFSMYNRTRSPRGYSGGYYDRVKYFSVDYTLPICYPDVNIDGILYLKRIRGSLFYDYAMLGSVDITHPSDPITWDHIHSKGVELMADFHIFRIPYEISAGPRAIWLKQSKLPIVEAAFSIDIYGNQIGKGRMP